MTTTIHFILERVGQPPGQIRLSDLKSLASGVQDCMNRMIHLDMGYAPTSRTRQETEKLGEIFLVGIEKGSCDLVCRTNDPAHYRVPPSAFALHQLNRGIKARQSAHRWPAWMPETARTPLGRVVSRLVTHDGDYLRVRAVNPAFRTVEFELDVPTAVSLAEPDPISEGTPVRIVGEISVLHLKSRKAIIRAGTRTIELVMGSEDLFERCDELRWKRVRITGEAQSDRCRVVTVRDLAAASDDDQPGLSAWTDQSEGSSPVRYVEERLREFRTYERGWDSYDAKKVSYQILNYAGNFFHGAYARLADRGFRLPDVFVCPTTAGGVQFEWDIHKRSLELEVKGQNEFAYLRLDPNKELEEEGDCARWTAMRLIEWAGTAGEP